MRAPEFWWREGPSPEARLLQPFGALFGAISGLRYAWAKPIHAGCPVICIGNFTAGGAGKTPTAMALAALLRKVGERPAFLTRGYGGSLSRTCSSTLVDCACHTVSQTGDEPLLLANVAPTFISARRPCGAAAALKAGAGVIIMDDGLQNFSVAKDFSLAVVDAATGIGNGLCLPAGPLRAPLTRQWCWVDAVLLVGQGRPGERLSDLAVDNSKPVLRASLVPDPESMRVLKGKRLVAFAGIGRPEKFFQTLESLRPEHGLDLVARRSFADHHPYSKEDLQALQQLARQHDAQLVTTQKDMVRLSHLVPESLAEEVLVLPVHLEFSGEDETRLLALVNDAILAHRTKVP